MNIKKLSIGLIFLLSSANTLSGIIYEQLWEGSLNGGASRIDGQQMADDFTLSANSTLKSIKWWGIDTDGNLSDLPATDFNIRIYQNENLPPLQTNSALIRPQLTPSYTGTITANLLYTGDSGFFPAQPVGRTFSLVEYSGDLDTPITLQANNIYWLSILDSSDNTQFDWAFVLPGSSVFRSCCDSDGSPWIETGGLNADLAFVLSDEKITSIRLPSTVYLFISGLISFFYLTKRKDGTRCVISVGYSRSH